MTMSTGKGKKQGENAVAWFVPDSNFFLQCKPASDVDWSLVTAAQDVRLLIVRTVQDEIDDLKGNGNARRASKARATSSLFRSILRAQDGRVVLRESDPVVSVEFGPRLDPAREKPEGLDLTVNDDRLVEETMGTALVFGHDISLLTGDTGPMLTARDVGCPWFEVPEEWALDPEPDPDKKRLNELERKVEQLAARDPKITVDVSQGGEQVRVIKGTVDAPAVLTDAFIERMQKLVAKRHPKKLRPDEKGVTIFREGEWQGYWTRYDAWLDDLGARMHAVARQFNLTAEPVGFQLHIDNTGGATAASPVVEIVAHGPIRLTDGKTRKTMASVPGMMFPPAPDAPAQWAQSLNRTLAQLNSHPAALYPGPSEVHTTGKDFHWAYAEPVAASLKITGECLELRHGLGGVTAHFQVVPEPDVEGPVKGSLSVRVSAPNLPEPYTTRIPVEIGRRPTGTEERIFEKLREEFELRRRTLKDLGIS